jgi:hypothetical protein
VHKDGCLAKKKLEACYLLGMDYARGEGTTKNLKSARQWLDVSCQFGIKKACNALKELGKGESTLALRSPMITGRSEKTNGGNDGVWSGYYGNDKLGFSFNYPENIFIKKRVPDAGDGIILSGSGGLEFSAFSAVYDQRINDVYYEVLEVEREEGSRISYKTLHRNWYVISGVYKDKQTFFYKKAFFEDNFGIYLEFKYRIQDKSKYDSLVKKMMRRVTIKFP